MNAKEICYNECDELIGSVACRFCKYGNPCLYCDYYNLELNTCESKGGCFRDMKGDSHERK